MANYIQPQAPGSHWIQTDQYCVPSASFQDMMYAFPRPRHTGRVMKPRSAGNSPSSAGRWRAAAPHGSPTYQSLQAQPYQTQVNPALLASALRRRATATRPISWHPASLETAVYSSPPYFQTTAAENLAVMAPSTQPIGPASTTLTDGSMLPSYVSPEFSAPTESFSFTTMPDPASMQQSAFLDMSGSQIVPVSWDDNAPTVTQPMPDSWPFDMMSMNNSIPSGDVEASGYASAPSSGYLTGPSTPDFLPIQHPESTSKTLHKSTSDEQPGDELVGMGLYSHPDPFLDTSFHGVPGKGLKLEETFTPSSDDEADDSKDAESEDDNQQTTEQASASGSAPVQKQTVIPTANMMQKSFFFDDDDIEQQTMSAPQQLLNLGSQPCMNYGYGWI
ncbi:hypothetical protein BDV26DRAFT_263855 [Aspergillus bertholletiae]|uniref:Uncharacterized protein n=1 Tax=Aspergillus bertholletiae TaxID=1226010 RepID=A0A5N7B751_9EURO|nr:hypothetical protein BDV26DRAFT_263855 [Aspergillus bertholletiae]